jgi:hypothetical protein
MAPSLNALLDFLKSASVSPSSRPGFARVLQVSHSFLSPTNLSILHRNNNDDDDDDDNEQKNASSSLSTPKPIVRYRGQHESSLSLGLLFAIMDEMTTNATFLHGCPTPPGASIHIRLELASSRRRQQYNHHPNQQQQQQQQQQWSLLPNNNNNNNSNSNNTNEFVMDSSVIKSGKTLCFSDCKIWDATDNNRMIAFGSQVKYLPTGSWVMDTLFTSPLLWNLFVQTYVRRTDPPADPPPPHLVGSAHDHLVPESQSIGRATFRTTPYLTNPFGALHVRTLYIYVLEIRRGLNQMTQYTVL